MVTATLLLFFLFSSDQRQETAHVVVTPVTVKAPIVAGKPLTLRLEVAPKPKMHIYSPKQKDYIPVSLTVEKSSAYTAKPAVFPEPEKYFFAALDETQLVYSKPFQIAVPIVVRTPGHEPVVVKGILEYQACDDAICYRPVKVPVEWKLTRSRANRADAISYRPMKAPVAWKSRR